MAIAPTDTSTLLLEFSQSLIGSHDTEQIMDQAVRTVAEALGVSQVALAILDPQEETASIRAAVGWPADLVAAYQDLPVSVSDTLKQLLKTRNPLVIPDTCAETRFASLKSAQGHGVSALLMVPLQADGQPIGALLASHPKPHAWADEEVRLLALVANLCAQALERIRLFRELQENLHLAHNLQDALGAGAQLTASQSVDAVLSGILDRLTEVLPFDSASVLLLDEGETRFRASHHRGYERFDAAALIENGPEADKDGYLSLKRFPSLGAIVQSKEPLVISDVAQYPEWTPTLATRHVRSWAAAPILIDGRVRAVFSLDKAESGFYQDFHAELLTAFAGQAALGLRNAELIAQLRQQIEQLTVLNAVAVAGTRLLDENALIEQATSTIGESLYPDNFGVLLLDRDRGELRIHPAYRGISPEQMEVTVPLGQGITGWVAQHGQPRRVNDIRLEPEYLDVAASTCAELAVPLIVGDEILGVVNTESNRLHAFSAADEQLLTTLAGQLALGIQNIRQYTHATQRLEELDFLHQATQAITTHTDLNAALAEVAHLLDRQLHYPHVAVALLNPQSGMIELRAQHGMRVADWGPGGRGVQPGEGLVGWVIDNGEPLLVPDVTQDPRYVVGIPETRSELVVPLKRAGRAIGVINVESPQPNAFSGGDLRLLSTLARQIVAGIERALNEEETTRRVKELAALAGISGALRAARTLDEFRATVVGATLKALNAQAGTLFLVDDRVKELTVVAAVGYPVPTENLRLKFDQGLAGRVVLSGQPIVVADIAADPRIVMPDAFVDLHKAICMPIRAQDRVIGAFVICYATRGEPDPAEVHLLAAIAEMVGGAIQRAELNENTIQNLRRLEALRAIDDAVKSILNMDELLETLLDELTRQLDFDAAGVLLADPTSLALRGAAGRGLQHVDWSQVRLAPGEDYAGRAVLERRSFVVPDLRERRTGTLLSPFFLDEKIVTYIALPMIARGQVMGVLELFHRSRLELSPEWVATLEQAASLAGLALANASLFADLEHSNQELTQAYDATIEGWSHALDLRDHETEGHSRRVADLAVLLAQKMGVDEAELGHIRRGALLHDIGKMGIPDEILLKPGALTDAERQIVQRHPQLAYEMLVSMTYLQPGLDIPYCHHEKWDGSGYPRGLAGEDIPFAARIFAVVDVFDALTSHRPYRAAWSKSKALDYIREQSGQHFDPAVTRAFLKLVRT